MSRPFFAAVMALALSAPIACGQPAARDPVVQGTADPAEPDAVEPDAVEPDAVEPDAVEPDPAEPARPPDPIAAAPAPVDGETPPEAVARCQATDSFEACVLRALDEREVRAREREILIEAHLSLGNEARAHEHMQLFLDEYPRDRRGNRYRMILHGR